MSPSVKKTANFAATGSYAAQAFTLLRDLVITQDGTCLLPVVIASAYAPCDLVFRRVARCFSHAREPCNAGLSVDRLVTCRYLLAVSAALRSPLFRSSKDLERYE